MVAPLTTYRILLRDLQYWYCSSVTQDHQSSVGISFGNIFMVEILVLWSYASGTTSVCISAFLWNFVVWNQSLDLEHRITSFNLEIIIEGKVIDCHPSSMIHLLRSISCHQSQVSHLGHPSRFSRHSYPVPFHLWLQSAFGHDPSLVIHVWP